MTVGGEECLLENGLVGAFEGEEIGFEKNGYLFYIFFITLIVRSIYIPLIVRIIYIPLIIRIILYLFMPTGKLMALPFEGSPGIEGGFASESEGDPAEESEFVYGGVALEHGFEGAEHMAINQVGDWGSIVGEAVDEVVGYDCLQGFAGCVAGE